MATLISLRSAVKSFGARTVSDECLYTGTLRPGGVLVYSVCTISRADHLPGPGWASSSSSMYEESPVCKTK